MASILYRETRAIGRYYSEAIANLESAIGRRVNPDSIQTHLCVKCAPSSVQHIPDHGCPDWIVNV